MAEPATQQDPSPSHPHPGASVHPAVTEPDLTRRASSPQAVFQYRFLQEILQRARVLLRDHGPEAREEALQEILARCWASFQSAWNRGKAQRLTAYTLMHYAHRHYRAGRRIAARTRNDAMSALSRAQRRVRLASTAEQVTDRRHDPAEQVRWQIDLQQMVGQLTPRQRRVLSMTAAGWRTRDMAAALDVTPSAIVKLQNRIGVAFRKAGYG